MTDKEREDAEQAEFLRKWYETYKEKQKKQRAKNKKLRNRKWFLGEKRR